jgi:hypothetical protein
MRDLEKAINAIIGREPNAEEIAKFYKVKEACGFSDHDSVWSLLLAFGHYEILYGEIPSKIASQVQTLLAEHKLSLDATANAAQKHIQENLVTAVAETAQKMADQVIKTGQKITIYESRRKFILGVVLSIGVATISLIGVAWQAFSLGTRANAAETAWLRTPEGIAARQFSELNSVKAMLDCPIPFQIIKNDKGEKICLPYDRKVKLIHGWRIR